MRHVVSILSLLTAGLLGGCSSSDGAALVERTDSAGVTLVSNTGGDRALDWRFEPVLRLGGADEGPESFYRLNPAQVGVDDAGRIHVLDAAAHRVVVFDSAGRHVRTFGSEGDGPGEMRWPAAVSVAANGSVVIADHARSGLKRWDSSGIPIGEMARGLQVSSVVPRAFALLEGGVAAIVNVPAAGGGYEERLITLSGADTIRLTTVTHPPHRVAELGCVAMDMAPRFSPRVVWNASGSRVAAATTAAYDVLVSEGDRRMRIRRALPPREVTREMALRDFGDGITVAFGPGMAPCKVSADVLVEQQGYAPLLPAVSRVALSPDGSIWVARGRIEGEPQLIDLFDAEGVYRGTLPPDLPFPAAFTPAGDVVSIESDELDVDRLVVYRIDRGGS